MTGGPRAEREALPRKRFDGDAPRKRFEGDASRRPGERPSSEVRRPSVPVGPPVPDEVTGKELDREVRAELSSLGTHGSVIVARHLVMVGRLLDEDPELAWEHALAARGRGARISVVREATGLAAYHTGRYGQALAELRTLRRLTGSSAHLAVMADCERGLGRPERALALAASPEAARLSHADQMELRIVTAGARADLGQLKAAVITLQIPELQSTGGEEWLVRLQLAYARALAAVGRTEEAATWAERAGLSLEDALDDDLHPSDDAPSADSDLVGDEDSDGDFLDLLEEPQ